MPDHLTPVQRHDNMARIRSRDTKPEIKVRRALFCAGFRFRIYVRTLPGKPDIVLPKFRTVIFVNGCFWHGHGGCRYYTVPKTNTAFWEEKVQRNIERDLKTCQMLESLSWHIITVWECELKPHAFNATIDRVINELQENKKDWERYQDRRRSDREYAKNENKRKKLLQEQIKRELKDRYRISFSTKPEPNDD